jgi:hypothetical protein
MSVVHALTSIGLSSVSRSGVGSWGPSAWKALMVLPTWSLARWLGWPEFAGVGGVCLLALAALTMIRIQ